MTESGDTTFLGDVTLGGNTVNDIAVAADAAGTSDSILVTQGYVNANAVPAASTSWTPIIKGLSTAGVFTYHAGTEAEYIIYGPLVWFRALVRWTAITTTPVGSMIIEASGGGMPVLPAGAGDAPCMIADMSGVTFTGAPPFGNLNGANDRVELGFLSSNAALGAVDGSDLASAGLIVIAGWYEKA